VIGEKNHEQRILVVDPVDDHTRLVSPAELYVYQYDWSPDDSQFAVTAAHGSGDNNWYIAGLYLIDAASGSTRLLLKPPTQIAVPRWSPDGRQIAFVAGLMSDEGIANGDLHVIPTTGGRERDVTPHLGASIFWFSWLPHSTNLVLAEARDGGSAVMRLNAATGNTTMLWHGPQTIRAAAGFARSLSLTRNGTESAVILQSFNQPPSLRMGATGAWRLFRTPATSLKTSFWGRAQSIHWRSDRFNVQGWLVPPKAVTPGHQYPMVVWVHGGPAWLNAPAWPTSREGSLIVTLAGEGYFVFLPNPRGSAGWGEAFEHANVKDFGGGDLRDILAGVHEVVATRPVDEHRIGITGWSYGGYMTMWALTQTREFRAAVAGAGLADWLSYYGENGIDEWMIPYFGASVYDDPAVYAKSSPIDFIKSVRTPTLILVGEYDIECPPPQSFEYWHALRTLHVKSELVVYPGEGHGFSKPKDEIDVLSRSLAWFDDNMRETHAAPVALKPAQAGSVNSSPAT
jgi:dipeptidyl aminopeptidase/acylaminoacyl peptidase